MSVNLTFEQHKKKCEQILRSYGHDGVWPTAHINGESFTKAQQLDACKRVYNYALKNKKLPDKVWWYNTQTSSSSTSSSSNMSAYLKETKNCQVTNSTIKAKGASLKTGAKIFAWVRDALEYIYYYNTKYGAVGTINNGGGDCCDLTHVIIAIARAAGIPARYVHNTSVKFTKITTGHVWAELYINGVWVRADASNNGNQLGVNPRDSQLLGTTKRYAELPF